MKEKILICPVCEKSDFSLLFDVKDYFLTSEEFSIQKCNNCGFKFVNPRPDKSEIGRYYQSDQYISHNAAEAKFINRVYKLARRFSILKKYKIVYKYAGPGKILDIGCGTGEFLNYCKSRGFEVTGIEPNKKARVFAQQENKTPVFCELAELSADKGSCNCITMWHVLEHIHDLNETLEMVKYLISRNGILIVAVPNCNSWDAGKYGNFWAAYDVPRHLYHFTESTMKKLLTNHGFEILTMLPQKLDAFYVSMLSEKYRSGKNNYFISIINGFRSNMHAWKPGRGYSSQIFVCSMKKT